MKISDESSRQEENIVIEGKQVVLGSKSFRPSDDNPKTTKFSKSTVIFLTGILNNADSKSIKPLCQTFANETGADAFAIDNPGEKVAEAAEAIRQFIKQKQLKNIIIAGNSLGGVKAMHLVNLITEKNRDIVISGLILINSGGLYEQSALTYPVMHVVDFLSTKDSIAQLAKNAKGKRTITQNQQNYEQDAWQGLVNEPKNPLTAYNNLQEVTRKHPGAATIRVPVIIVHGLNDLSFQHDKIMPNSDPVIDETLSISQRESHIQETIFPNSPYVRVLVPEKVAHHNTMYLHGDIVAHDALELLNGWQKRAKK
jgi:pimeloyl-ACP methyl ester carboxylesterase